MVALFDKLVQSDGNGRADEVRRYVETVLENMKNGLKKQLDIARDAIRNRFGMTLCGEELLDGLFTAVKRRAGVIIDDSKVEIYRRCSERVRKRNVDYSLPVRKRIGMEVDAVNADNRKKLRGDVMYLNRRITGIFEACSEMMKSEMGKLLSRVECIGETVSEDVFSEESGRRMTKDIADIVARADDHEEMVRRSVLGEVRRILGTRTHLRGVGEPTILNYGLKTPAGMSAYTDRDALCTCIRDAVTAFEPRLSDVNVSFDSSVDTERQAGYSITGKIVGTDRVERIFFAIKDGNIASGA